MKAILEDTFDDFLKFFFENTTKIEDIIEILTNQTKKTMGIEEFVLARAERIGEKRGIEKGIERGVEAKTISFIETLITQTDFNDDKIASLAAVSTETVQKLRK